MIKVPTVDFYKDRKGEWRWRLRATNGRTICDSAEGYKTRAKCKHGFKRVAECAPHAVEV